jgi:hypothetical protein
MQITELLLAELNREAVGIRKTLERVPERKNDWKPHERLCHSVIWRRLSPPFRRGRYGGEHGRVGHQSQSSSRRNGRRDKTCWSSSRPV